MSGSDIYDRLKSVKPWWREQKRAQRKPLYTLMGVQRFADETDQQFLARFHGHRRKLAERHVEVRRA